MSNIRSNIISPNPTLDSRGHEVLVSYIFDILQIGTKQSIKNTKTALIITISEINKLNCIFYFVEIIPIMLRTNAVTFNPNAPDDPII